MKTNDSRYALRCMAPDGAIVTEGHFPTIEAAWQRSSDMGSRWFFYPIHLVTGSTCTAKRARILAEPSGMPDQWKGKTVGRLALAVKANPEITEGYCNEGTPFCVWPE